MFWCFKDDCRNLNITDILRTIHMLLNGIAWMLSLPLDVAFDVLSESFIFRKGVTRKTKDLPKNISPRIILQTNKIVKIFCSQYSILKVVTTYWSSNTPHWHSVPALALAVIVPSSLSISVGVNFYHQIYQIYSRKRHHKSRRRISV